MLYVGFGVVCGLASGFSYNAVLRDSRRMAPDKQGLVSGILLMGFRPEQLPHRQALSALHAGDGRQLAAQLCRARCYHGRARGGLRLPAPAARHGLPRRRPPRKRSVMLTPWQKSSARRPCCGGPRSGCTILGGTSERGRAGPSCRSPPPSRGRSAERSRRAVSPRPSA